VPPLDDVVLMTESRFASEYLDERRDLELGPLDDCKRSWRVSASDMRDGPGTGGSGEDGGLDGGGLVKLADCGVTGIWDGGRGKASRRRGTGVRRDEDMMGGGGGWAADEDSDDEERVFVAVCGDLQPSSSSLRTMVGGTPVVGVAGVKEKAKVVRGGAGHKPIWADHIFS
jgi:hypothetical protein